MFYKIVWGIRAILYSLFLGSFKFPGYLGAPTYIHGFKKIFIGRKVRIFPNVRLEAHQEGKIFISNDVSIGQNVHITSASNLIIGSSTTILANVFITNFDHDYRDINVHVMNQKFIINETFIGENCYIGIGSCIQAGTILGRQCVVGANSVVRGTFPDFSVIAGVPAKIIKRYNQKTLRWQTTNLEGDFI